MRKMNCRSVRREIEEQSSGDLLSSPANNHMKDCTQCGTFRDERLKLREMLSSLGAVEAPGDFDFRLRARLANEKRGGSRPYVMLFFGFRSAGVAATLLLIGSALLFLSLRTPPSSPLTASDTKPTTTRLDGIAKIDSAPLDVVGGEKPTSPNKPQKLTFKRADGFKRGEVASLHGEAGSNGRLKTRELSSTGAPVLRPINAMDPSESAVFPIEASFQSLRVSLDDGRGSSRTISVPSVSFGSQRVLAQSSSPLLASTRSDW